MITVLGRATSLNVQFVMWAIAELGLDHEREDVGGSFGGNNTPEYLALNPNGLVPVVRDKSTYLWESAAIVRYLGAEYGTEQFWPADPLKRATLDKWAEWIKTTFGPALLPQVFWQLVTIKPENRDEKILATGVAKLKQLVPMIDARLAEADYLGGGDICFADILVGTPLYRYYTLDFDKAKTPHLDAYYRRLTQRPTYATHVMVSYESLRAR